MIQKLLKSILLASFFAALFFVRPNKLQATCNAYDPSTGCPASSPNQCPAPNNNLCCGNLTECSQPANSGCNPGAGFIPLGDCLQLSDDSKVSDVYTTPSFLVNLVVRNLFVFAGVVFFFMILLAGFQFISGGKKGAENAKQIMTAAAIGFILMFAAYWIVQIVKIVTRTNIIL